jgi:phosphatidylglycerophosphate synthase
MQSRSRLTLLKESYRSKERLEKHLPFVARFVYRPISFYLAIPFVVFRVSADQVTLIRLPLALIAAGLIATGGRGAVILGCSLYSLGTLLDYVDGNLARLYATVSTRGRLLDELMHVVERVVLPLALGAAVVRRPDWPLRAAHYFSSEVPLGAGVFASIAECLCMIAILESRLMRRGGECKSEPLDSRSPIRRTLARFTYRTVGEASYALQAVALIFFAVSDTISVSVFAIAAIQVFKLRNAVREVATELRNLNDFL